MLLANKQKLGHIKPVLEDLCLLPVSDRITFKVLVNTLKCLNGHTLE